MRWMTLAIVAASALSAHAAGEMPIFDVERHCDRVARVGGPRSELIYSGCFDQEQGSYDVLKSRWAEIPSAVRDQCQQVARSTGSGSYMILQGCIQMEEDSATRNQRRQFRR